MKYIVSVEDGHVNIFENRDRQLSSGSVLRSLNDDTPFSIGINLIISGCVEEQNTRGESRLLKTGVSFGLVVNPFNGFANKLTQCFLLQRKVARAEVLMYAHGLASER